MERSSGEIKSVGCSLDLEGRGRHICGVRQRKGNMWFSGVLMGKSQNIL